MVTPRLPQERPTPQSQPQQHLSQSALDIPRSGIRDVFDRVDAVPDAISLCVGEPSDTAAPHIVEAACASMRNGQTKYTNILGIEEFRTAVARYSAEVKGLRYDPRAEIQAVDGATMGLFLALKTVVGPGDEVIIPSPFFTSYDAEVMLCGADVITVPLRAQHHMQLNADDIERAITPRTKAVILNSPAIPRALSPLLRSCDASRRCAFGMISGRYRMRYIIPTSSVPRRTRSFRRRRRTRSSRRHKKQP